MVGPEPRAQSSGRPLGRLFQAEAVPGAGALIRLEEAGDARLLQQSGIEGSGRRGPPGLKEESEPLGQGVHKLAALS